MVDDMDVVRKKIFLLFLWANVTQKPRDVLYRVVRRLCRARTGIEDGTAGAIGETRETAEMGEVGHIEPGTVLHLDLGLGSVGGGVGDTVCIKLRCV